MLGRRLESVRDRIDGGLEIKRRKYWMIGNTGKRGSGEVTSAPKDDIPNFGIIDNSLVVYLSVAHVLKTKTPAYHLQDLSGHTRTDPVSPSGYPARTV